MNINCLALLVQWWVPDKWFRAGHEPWQWGSMVGGRTRTQAAPPALATIPSTARCVMFPTLGCRLCSLLPTQSLDC